MAFGTCCKAAVPNTLQGLDSLHRWLFAGCKAAYAAAFARHAGCAPVTLHHQ